MAELTEQQLLVLNCLMYVKVPMEKNVPLGKLAEELLKMDHIPSGAGMSTEDVKEVLRMIENDNTLKELRIVDSVDGEIKAACFVDNQDNATVVYRGTGDMYVSWDDNFQGGYMIETDMQEQALEFAQKQAEDYPDLTVSGHSKGGNMAQYVTVRMGDDIDRCVSFDGQGFGDEFLDTYADEVAANKDKIRSVNAYNDYVNILLTNIAGETVYLDNRGEGKDGHSPFTLLTTQGNEPNADGEYTTNKKQSLIIRGVEEILDGLVEWIDRKYPGAAGDIVEMTICSLLGALVGSIFGEDMDWWDIPAMLENMKKNVEEYFQDRTDHTKDYRIVADSGMIRAYAGTVGSAARQLDMLQNRIERIRKQIADNIIDGVAIGHPLKRALRQLDQESAKLERLSKFLNESAKRYEDAEHKAGQII